MIKYLEKFKMLKHQVQRRNHDEQNNTKITNIQILSKFKTFVSLKLKI